MQGGRREPGNARRVADVDDPTHGTTLARGARHVAYGWRCVAAVTTTMLTDPVLGSEALAYDQACERLYTVSDTRAAAMAAVDRSADQAKAARLLGAPDLTIGATELFGEKTGAIEDTPFGNIPFSENFKGPRSSIDSTWPIYTGGRITATQKALASGVKLAQAELARTEASLDVLLAKAYFGLELAANVAATRDAILEQADRQLAKAFRFEQQGLIPRVERLSAQVARDEAAREQIKALRDREIAEATLRRLLHLEEPLTTSTRLFVDTRPLEPLERWLAWAEERSPSLAALAARRAQSEQAVRLAEAAWRPEIFAFGSYALIRKYQTLIEPDWTAGIGVKLAIVSHTDRAHSVSAAHHAVREVTSLEAATVTELETRVEANYRRVAQTREQFGLLDSTLALAEENLRLREQGFGEGQTTSLDVSDARNSVARSRSARAEAAYEFDVALAELLDAAGKTASLPDYIRQANVQVTP